MTWITWVVGAGKVQHVQEHEWVLKTSVDNPYIPAVFTLVSLYRDPKDTQRLVQRFYWLNLTDMADWQITSLLWKWWCKKEHAGVFLVGLTRSDTLHGAWCGHQWTRRQSNSCGHNPEETSWEKTQLFDYIYIYMSIYVYISTEIVVLFTQIISSMQQANGQMIFRSNLV